MNARRDFFGKLGALGASAVVGTQGGAPRTPGSRLGKLQDAAIEAEAKFLALRPGRDLERLRLCAQMVNGAERVWGSALEHLDQAVTFGHAREGRKAKAKERPRLLAGLYQREVEGRG